MKMYTSLKNILTFNFILAATLPILIFGIIALYILTVSMEKEISDKNFLLAKSLASEVERFLEEPLRLLRQIKDIIDTKGLILKYINTYLDSVITNYRFFDMIMVIDHSGTVRHLAPYDKNFVGNDMSGHAFFQITGKSDRVYWSPAFISLQTGQPTLTVSIPISQGMIVGYLNLAALNAITAKIAIGPHGYAWICDKDGTLIAHPDSALVDQRLNMRRLNVVQQAMKGNEGTFQYRFKGMERLGSAVIVPHIYWIVTVTQPVEEAYAPVRGIRKILWAGTSVAISLAMLIALVSLRKTLQPLSQLTEHSQKIAAGDYHLFPHQKQYREVDELAHNFDVMVAAVKSREEALRASEGKRNALFGAMTEMVVLHELVYNDRGEAVNYRITDCNHAFTAVTGIKKDDAAGKLATEVYQGESAPYLEEFSRVAFTGESYEFTIYYPPMDKHFMISVVSPQKGQFATVTTDITAIKQIQDVIFAKNKELENYLYVASHDLRSPLVNIQGFSQRLKKQTDAIKQALSGYPLETDIQQTIEKITDEGIPKSLDFIFTNVSKMDTLINGLLKISRTGRVNMTIQKIDMNNMLENVMRAFNFQLEEAAADVVVEHLPDCYGDVALLNQLFSNIIGNALKYRDNDRQLVVTVTAQTQYNKVTYSIQDTGIGIAQRHLEKIWDVFYRVGSQSPEAGEGIGLSIVKRIVDKHKGKIRVESEAGKGSVFSIELPGHEFSE